MKEEEFNKVIQQIFKNKHASTFPYLEFIDDNWIIVDGTFSINEIISLGKELEKAKKELIK